jgi:hypothetical protein
MTNLPPPAELTPADWRLIDANMRVVRLTIPLRILVPALIFPALPKGTRGLTLVPGRAGTAIGLLLVMASSLVGYLLFPSTGPWGAVFSIWLVGTVGFATVASALRPTAFVKPICARCRLLPVIREHEAIHISGVASEKGVWDSMKTRHSVESLALSGDPAICYFCPIPKRLSEQ